MNSIFPFSFFFCLFLSPYFFYRPFLFAAVLLSSLLLPVAATGPLARFCAVSSLSNLNATTRVRMNIIKSEMLPRFLHISLAKLLYYSSFCVFIRKFYAKPSGRTASSRPANRRAKRRAAASVFSRAGSRVCMTDSGAIESDLERFQKTFSRSPTYKAALSPRERRAGAT